MPSKNYDYLKEALKTEAQNLGFFKIGFCSPNPSDGYQQYLDWLEKGFAANMDYLSRPDAIQKRGNPRLLMENARTIIVLALPYVPAAGLTNSYQYPLISSYAWGRDYHRLIPQKLELLAEWLKSELKENLLECKIFTDTAPILERSLAVAAGLGWIGKQSCLLIPQAGSYFFLAELFVNIEFSPDLPFNHDLCGICQRCIQACPTNCIQPDRTIDANKCISFLTIENKKQIPRAIHEKTGNWVFGCDICQQVCPWNLRFATQPVENDFEKSVAVNSLNPIEILNMKGFQFKETFSESPLSRAKLTGMKRNVINWMGNSANPDYLPALIYALQVEHDPIIRDQLYWAKEQLESRKSQ